MNQTVVVREAAKANKLPRGILVGMALLVSFALTASSLGRLTGVGTLQMPRLRAVETLVLRFVDQDDGGVSVQDASDGRIFYEVAPGTNGFVRATLRGLVSERKRDHIGPETPFTLSRWSDGTISLGDSTTGRRINLDAFGPTNAQAFAILFAARDRAR